MAHLGLVAPAGKGRKAECEGYASVRSDPIQPQNGRSEKLVQDCLRQWLRQNSGPDVVLSVDGLHLDVCVALEAVGQHLHRKATIDALRRMIPPAAMVSCMCRWAIADLTPDRGRLNANGSDAIARAVIASPDGRGNPGRGPIRLFVTSMLDRGAAEAVSKQPSEMIVVVESALIGDVAD